METTPPTIVTVDTRQYGMVACEVDRDGLGNPRLFPVNGATLSEWRADKRLIPPWLLPADLVRADDWPSVFPD